MISRVTHAAQPHAQGAQGPQLHLIHVDSSELRLLTQLREAPDNLRMMSQMILDRFLAGGQEVG
jgi:hypothetical protein